MAPPLDLGAVNEIVALVELVAVTVSTVGIPGSTGDVVTEFEADEALDVPTILVAEMVKVYAVFPVNPVTVIVPLPA